MIVNRYICNVANHIWRRCKVSKVKEDVLSQAFQVIGFKSKYRVVNDGRFVVGKTFKFLPHDSPNIAIHGMITSLFVNFESRMVVLGVASGCYVYHGGVLMAVSYLTYNKQGSLESWFTICPNNHSFSGELEIDA